VRQSQLFANLKKEPPKETESVSHKLLVRADFIDQMASGVYNLLPLGQRVYQNIENIIRKEMTALGGQEVSLQSMVPKKLWQETGRWTSIDPPLFRVKDRHGREFGLGSTHEEVITDIVRRRVKSYKDLPFSLFQIQDKFRNELRASGGLLRVREFVMKDLYSFHESREDAVKFYEKVKKSYFRIFKRCGLKPVCVEADPGTIGGELSHEFMVISPTGEDKVLICQKCHWAGNVEKFKNIKICPKCQASLKEFSSIESAHAFYLGTKYSKAMGANFIDRQGKLQTLVMGCYGIGLGRLMAAIVEANHDKKGIIWPEEVAPFDVHLIDLGEKQASEKAYKDLQAAGVDVLYDDREERTAGEKFAEADLIGIPWRVVISERTLRKNSAEVKARSKKELKIVKLKNLLKIENW